jgi:transposase InsO family protein
MKEPAGITPAAEPSSPRLFDRVYTVFRPSTMPGSSSSIAKHSSDSPRSLTCPRQNCTPYPIAWPFTQWGLNKVGPLPKLSQGSHTYLLVIVDKFSKWTEVVPVTNQEATTVVKFFESIVYRYGVPNNIITDNDTNFTSGEFQEFAKELGIKIKYASVAHPKSNGQVKKANGLVCAGLKKRLLRPLKHAAGA